MPLYGEAASADTNRAHSYVEDEFPKLINFLMATYLSKSLTWMKQVFFRRGCLFVHSSSRMNRPGFKAHKDCVTLIMCSDAAGFMLNPGLIYKVKNPRLLKNKNKTLLPVY